MKTHYLVTAALAALALGSCTREKADIDGKPVEVNVTILGTAPTRATSVTYDNESKVGNLQVYVFNNGKLEDYQDAGAAMTAQLTATSGERTVWALVNAPTLKDVSTETELQAKVSQLADNKTDAFVPYPSRSNASFPGSPSRKSPRSSSTHSPERPSPSTEST